MGLELARSQSPVRLHIRCENCLRESSRVLEPRPGAELSDDPCALAEEGYLDNLPFFCGHCESVIGRLFAISGGKRYG
ncbi:hypothetical protein LCM4573_21445 [Rhizobium sp. LCM 4573]|nr:hypothetical protein LCM4573_21445 [Rhizobium sp. LCM 4573]